MKDKDNIVEISEKQKVQVYDGIEVDGLEELDFEGIEAPRARMINFGEDFQRFSDRHKIEFLKKLASSMNHAADIMQQERNKALIEIIALKEQLANTENNLKIQRDIVLKTITDNNKAKDDYIKRIQELEETVRARETAIEILNEKLEGKV
jgi:hypothetical protein